MQCIRAKSAEEFGLLHPLRWRVRTSWTSQGYSRKPSQSRIAPMNSLMASASLLALLLLAHLALADPPTVTNLRDATAIHQESGICGVRNLDVQLSQSLDDIKQPVHAVLRVSFNEWCSGLFWWDGLDLPVNATFNPPGKGVLGAPTLRGTFVGANGGSATHTHAHTPTRTNTHTHKAMAHALPQSSPST